MPRCAATALFQLGVRGDRVALMPNCPEFVIAFYGALRINNPREHESM
jgi:acyl-CoA synthetase (AMP-forming)/AMP-acid ligase II